MPRQPRSGDFEAPLSPEEVDAWTTAAAPKALKLQRPLADCALRIVARGLKKDGLRN
jgi:hypothetical protein